MASGRNHLLRAEHANPRPGPAEDPSPGAAAHLGAGPADTSFAACRSIWRALAAKAINYDALLAGTGAGPKG